MTCERTQELFADYLTGDLAAGDRRRVQAHIAGCAACRADLESLTMVWAKLGVLPEEQPGPGLRHRFYGMLEEYKNAMPASERPRPRAEKPAPSGGWREWLSFRRPALAASLSGLLLLVGLGAGWFLAGGRTDARRVALLSSEVEDMRQEAALSLLSQPSASDRLQGVSYSKSVADPGDRTLTALFEALDTDPSPNVRLAAVEALYLFRNKPGVRENLVRSLAVQTYPLVQIALIDFLADVREERAAEALKSLIEAGELSPEVRERAERGLKQII